MDCIGNVIVVVPFFTCQRARGRSLFHHLRGRHRILSSSALSVERLEDRRLLAVQAFPVPLQPLEPGGAMVYYGTVAAAVDAPSEIESFTIDIDQGQKITLVVDPDSELTPQVELSDATGLLGAATSTADGRDAVLQLLPAVNAGRYTVDVSGISGSTGNFDLRLILNAAVEAESHDGEQNDTSEDAVDLEPTFLAQGGTRAAVLGTHATGAGVAEDWYRLQLEDSQSLSLTYDFSGAGNGTLELYDGDATTLLAVGSAADNLDQIIGN